MAAPGEFGAKVVRARTGLREPGAARAETPEWSGRCGARGLLLPRGEQLPLPAFYGLGVGSWRGLGVRAGSPRSSGRPLPPPRPFSSITWLGAARTDLRRAGRSGGCRRQEAGGRPEACASDPARCVGAAPGSFAFSRTPG